jgi:hypothetical protein
MVKASIQTFVNGVDPDVDYRLDEQLLDVLPDKMDVGPGDSFIIDVDNVFKVRVQYKDYPSILWISTAKCGLLSKQFDSQQLCHC